MNTTEVTNTRDDFSPAVIEILKKRAAFICSNPNCKVMTIAPSIEDENKVQYIGVAAHITAAAKGGPRFDEDLGEEKRKSISNAIFLCNNCATMIDKNKGIDYSKTVLYNWKEEHEKWILENLNKSVDGKHTININSVSENQSGGITANVVNVNGLNLNHFDDKKEHDKVIFKESDSLFNEDDLNVIIQSILGDESIWSTNQDKLERYRYFFEKSSNEYLNSDVEKFKNNLIESLGAVLRFLAYEFDMYPRSQPMDDGFKICMRPELNIDRKGTDKPGENLAHNELYKKLRDTMTKFEEDYKSYRRSVKTNLHI